MTTITTTTYTISPRTEPTVLPPARCATIKCRLIQWAGLITAFAALLTFAPV